VAAGCRVITPYLRGYGPTRFLTAGTLRSGQQAVLGHDLLALLDVLEISDAVLGGYDWGGRAACILAALWPERTRELVSCNGYNIQKFRTQFGPTCQKRNTVCGINITSTAIGGGQAWLQIVMHSASCCGGSGRPISSLMTRPMTARRHRSKTSISSMW
jgi:pimeloyl-ACP methyl ester carboxylesterase